MSVDPRFLDIEFERAGVRNSLKRLKELIEQLAVDPLKTHQSDLAGDFDVIEDITMKRVAHVISYWLINKHDRVHPTSQSLMGDITNARRNETTTLAQFYQEQVANALHTLSPVLGFSVPDGYQAQTDELEYALLELEEKIENEGIDARPSSEKLPEPEYDDYDEDDEDDYDDIMDGIAIEEFDSQDNTIPAITPKMVSQPAQRMPPQEKVRSSELNRAQPQPKPEQSIVVTADHDMQQVKRDIQLSVLNISSEDAWGMIYNLMGYPSDYIQNKLLPRWQQYPETFEKDRRFLYEMFIKTIQNASGNQMIAGNFTFSDGRMTIDQLWNYYFTDLSQNIAPQLAAARFENAANETRWQKFFRPLIGNIRNISPIWLLALVIALIFDGLTTYVSLDQTPMDGVMVWVFTVLITALFQIADILVINYRKREFEADAMMAKYKAKFEQLSQMIESLQTSSDSYVQFSMDRSQALADLKAAEDNRKMARRGRFWSARIADINVLVTAYGFAFMFLNAEEPMQALAEQLRYIFVLQTFENVNVWVFLMVALAVTVSFVINTAQRTEILGWTMKRLKSEA